MSIFGSYFGDPASPVTKEEATAVINETRQIMDRLGQRFPVLMTYWISTISKVIVTRATQTADVNLSGTVRVNPDFWRELGTSGRRAYLLCHEMMHPFCAHLDRRGSRDPQVWNVAGDAIINTILDTTADALGEPLFMDDDKPKERITLPAGYSADPAHLVTEMVYDYLCRNAPPPPPPDGGDQGDDEDGEGDDDQDGDQGQPGDEDGEGDGEGEGDGDGEGEGEGEGQGQGQGSKPGSKPGKGGGRGQPGDDDVTKGPQPQPGTGCGMREVTDSEDKAAWELRSDDKGKVINPKPVDLSNSQSVDQIQAKADSIESVLSQGGIGSGSGGFAGMIGKRDVRTDWRAILRRIISSEVSSGMNKDTYARMSRRGSSSPQIVKPGTYDDKVTIGLLMDVSGSVPREWVERSVGECVRVAKHYPSARLWAAAHTSRVIGPVMLEGKTLKTAQEAFTQLSLETGGTDCTEAYRLAEQAKPKIDVMVHFTDGEISPWPRLKGIKKLIVIVVGRSDASSAKAWAPAGTEIHLATDTGLRPGI